MTAVLSFLSWLASRLGIVGCLLLALWTYEEGLPFASYLAFPQSWPIVGGFGIGNVPVIGQFTVGHVQTYAAEQVKIATAAAQNQCDVRVAKLISGYEASALKAQLAAQAESQRQAEIVTSEYSSRLEAANAATDQKDKDLNDALERNEKLRIAAGNKCPALDAGTADLLRKHGFQIGQ